MHSQQNCIRFAIALSAVGLIALPASADTATFQQDVSGYAGTRDTMLSATFPTTNFGTSADCGMDLCCGTGGTLQGLVMFADIFGAGPGQIPLGSTINSATITVVVHNEDVEGPAFLNEVLIAWDEMTITWNSAGSGMSWDDVEAKSVAAATSPGGFNPIGPYALDVTGSLANWSAGETNNGWLFRQEDTDGTVFRSSNYGTVGERPLLEVDFTPPVCAADLSGNGVVDFADILIVIANWGPCP